MRLTPDEEWLLRHLDKHCPGLNARFTFSFEAWENPKKSDEPLKPVVDRMGLDQLRTAVSNLELYRLVHCQRSTVGILTGITVEGRQYVQKLDNPDIVDRIQQWVRRHRVFAWMIASATVLGVIGGLMMFILLLVVGIVLTLQAVFG